VGAIIGVVEGYGLLGAGAGRCLERFGDRLVDRPAPTSDDPRLDRPDWADADLRFDPVTGCRAADVGPWTSRFEELTLELRATDAGQVGLFPEHAVHWPWLRDRVAAQENSRVPHPFAYTRATTLLRRAVDAGASLREARSESYSPHPN
jgi:23S rRNA (cytosine1962-C5)-methyltransferase